MQAAGLASSKTGDHEQSVIASSSEKVDAPNRFVYN